jgi:hypothetical protein
MASQQPERRSRSTFRSNQAPGFGQEAEEPDVIIPDEEDTE